MKLLVRVAITFIIALALPICAHAQQAAYRFTAPQGWDSGFVDGTGYFYPPTGMGEGSSITLTPVQPAGPDLEKDAQAILTKQEQALGLNAVMRTPAKRVQMGGGPGVLLSGRYNSNDGQTVFILLYVFAEKGTVGAATLTTVTQEALSRHMPTASAMFESLHLTDEAAKLAAKNAGGGTQAPAQAQQKPPVQAQAPQIGAQTPPQPSKSPPSPPVMGNNVPAEGPAIVNLSQNSRNPLISLRELVGIWIGDTAYRNESFTFGSRTDIAGNVHNTLTYSFSSPMGSGGQYLKIYADGSYEFFHNFVFQSCGEIRKHNGTATLQNGLLTLRPTTGHESHGPVSKKNCETSERDVVPPAATYTVEVSAFDTAFGYPTYRLRLVNPTNSGIFYTLDRLDARPSPAIVPPMTRDYRPGTAHAGNDLIGTWVAPDDTPANFGADSEGDGKYHAVLRLFANGRYQLVSRRPDAIVTPVCVRHLQLVEEGEAFFGGQINPNNNANEFGAMTLKPQKSQLFAEVRNCGPDNRKALYDLSPGPRYMRWVLNAQRPVMAGPLAGDKLDVVCPDAYERANTGAWTFLACPEKSGQIYGGYVRR